MASFLNFYYQTGSIGFFNRFIRKPVIQIGRSLFVGWVEHLDTFCWVSFLNPTYLPAIFVLLAEPNIMAEDRTILPG